MLLIDDDPLVRAAFALLLAHWPDTELAGVAADGADGVEAAAELQPDVVLMDMRMPNVDGIMATRQITAACPTMPVILLSGYADRAFVAAAIDAGACHVLLKGGPPNLLRAQLLRAGGRAVWGQAGAAGTRAS